MRASPDRAWCRRRALPRKPRNGGEAIERSSGDRARIRARLQAHADQIAARIVELGGTPDFSPEELSCRSRAQYVEADNLLEMISADLAATQVAIDAYRGMVRLLGDDDPTTRWMLEGIVAMQEEHVQDLGSLLETLSV
jgi:bacterioferritin (cytochrome b1)